MVWRKFWWRSQPSFVVQVMSSCSKSDDNGGTPSAPDTTPVSVKVTYGSKIEADMLANADVEIEYLDASGNKKTN